jgi:group II intron reverse transcriptase/maturase
MIGMTLAYAPAADHCSSDPTTVLPTTPKPHGPRKRRQYEAIVPTVADRVAQTVVAMYLEDLVEPRFHPDSYGYRPRRSALDAVEVCRQRCWRKDWVIDLDVAKFFDTVPWDLMIKAVEAVTDTPWVLLYVRRWLAAPLMSGDGILVERDKGTPQGSAVSPVLANLFMHFAFDNWLAKKFPACPFERYADDAVVHCATRRQAEAVLAAIAERMQEVGLRLHPDKTRIVYCKDAKRRGDHEHTSFTFLGHADVGIMWASRTSAGRAGADGSGSGASRSPNGCGPSLPRSTTNSSVTGICPFPSKANGWPACCEGILPITRCRATAGLSKPSGLR